MSTTWSNDEPWMPRVQGRLTPPPLWMGDKPPHLTRTVKHNSPCLNQTWRHDLTLWPCVIWILQCGCQNLHSTELCAVYINTVTPASNNLRLLLASLGCLMQQLTTVCQKYVTQNDQPVKPPTFKNVRDCSLTPPLE